MKPIRILMLAFLPAFLVQPGFVWQEPGNQEPAAKDYSIRVESQLVQIYATVTDGSRRITDLKYTDFALTEDGAPRTADRLESSEDPLHIALLLDTSQSMRDALDTTKEAARHFVNSLQPADRVTLIAFNSDIRAIPQLTDDRAPILASIGQARAAGNTKLYDAVLFAMKTISGKDGRKAIVIFSDGEDTVRSSSIEVVLNAAARYGFPMYTIGAGTGLRNSTLQRVLRQLAEINSGKTYLVENPGNLRNTFEQVLSELRASYVLNYYTSVPHDGRWHDVKITLPNSRYKVHCRSGFYAKSAGAQGLFTELGSPRKAKTPGAGYAADPALLTLQARQAEEELRTKAASVPIPPDNSSIAIPQPARKTNEKKDSGPVFKVETRLVEVPVVVETPGEKDSSLLTEKDFRVYEDNTLREISYFSRDTVTQSIENLREGAILKVNQSRSQAPITLLADNQPLRLGRLYLVLDDMMTETGSFLRSKKTVEKIIREHHSPLRPVSFHLTSRSQADILPDEDTERMVQRVRTAMPQASRQVNSNDGIVTVHEAYLIERGDRQAQKVAELRFASSVQAQYQNELGTIDGQPGFAIEQIENGVKAAVQEMLVENASLSTRMLDGLRAVINAAAADPGDYSKTVILISSGFCLGRESTSAGMAHMLNSIIAAAKRSRVRVFTISASGLEVDEVIGVGASGSFLVKNPQLGSILQEHAQAWRMERQSPLYQLAAETGGQFLHSTNDIAAATASVIRKMGQLYYLGFVSKQPADARYHRIRVAVSLPKARVHARAGYFAGQQAAAPGATGGAVNDGEDVQAILARAENARKAGNLNDLAANLELLVRRFPSQTNLWYNLGVAHLNLGNAVKAVDALQKAFALAPEDRKVGLALVRGFITAGYRSAAGDTLEMILRRQPRDVDLLMQLGLVYESTGSNDRAYQAYRRILDVERMPPLDLCLALTRTAVQLGRKVEAEVFIHDYLARGGPPERVDGWRRSIAANGH